MSQGPGEAACATPAVLETPANAARASAAAMATPHRVFLRLGNLISLIFPKGNTLRTSDGAPSGQPATPTTYVTGNMFAGHNIHPPGHPVKPHPRFPRSASVPSPPLGIDAVRDIRL